METTEHLDRHPTEALLPDLRVWHRYAILLGDNGASGDALQQLWIAPALAANGPGHEPATEYVYRTDNGGSSLVGWLTDGGRIELADESEYHESGAECLAREAWARDALRDAGLID